MAHARAKIRLFVDAPLGADAGVGMDVSLTRDQAHYLFGVMRLGVGDALLVFNGRDGEWQAEVAEAGKRAGRLVCQAQTRPQTQPPDLWLCFAPIKKARTDFIAEKACEMGCARLLPVFTQHTNAERVNVDRLRAHAIEAAEQCGMVSVPEVAAPVSLTKLLEGWDPNRQILFCDETGEGPEARDLLTKVGASPSLRDAPWAVLIGPEGGFSPEEAERLRQMPGTHAVSLGPRILRADTAAVAALTLWQATLGDWR
ncbi:MAG: 16S rRNA (uracil(1498)-N(3))-methyltransferase [Pseudomonadota bacterium]